MTKKEGDRVKGRGGDSIVPMELRICMQHACLPQKIHQVMSLAELTFGAYFPPSRSGTLASSKTLWSIVKIFLFEIPSIIFPFSL